MSIKIDLPKIYPVTCHTDHVGPESIFVAIRGYKEDGTKYIKQAIELGAKKIILERNSNLKKTDFVSQDFPIEFIYMPDTRIALAELSAQELNYPAKKLKIIGITGTKGKTTTSFIIDHILRQAGYKTALMGTIKNKILDQELDSSLTSQPSDFLNIFFDQAVKAGVEYVIMEVSSHALSLNRIYGIEFETVGFTNLDSEHMDFYKDLQDYFQAKYLLFKQVKNSRTIIINSDNIWGQKAVELLNNNNNNLSNNIIPFGQNNYNHKNFLIFKILENNLSGLKIKINNNIIHAQNLFGEFNAYNIIMAKLITQNLGLDNNIIDLAIKNFTGTPGRLQIHRLKNGSCAFVDYAHNPSSMQAVLETLRPLTKDLIVVFGCGGDRDKTKRPVMGNLAVNFADKVIITDDNPRTEDRKIIAQEILSGIKQDKLNKVKCELNREKAIEQAVKLSTKNSVIALLGKGHENYYLINNQKFHFDDLEQISKY